jgi:DNA (cytosine-5)-methyltransferase 1
VPKGYPGHAGDPVPVTDGIRSLTTQERALIQTFPDSFQLPGTKSDVEQVIGNAVPVRLAHYVATRLATYIEESRHAQTLPMQGQLFEPAAA